VNQINSPEAYALHTGPWLAATELHGQDPNFVLRYPWRNSPGQNTTTSTPVTANTTAHATAKRPASILLSNSAKRRARFSPPRSSSRVVPSVIKTETFYDAQSEDDDEDFEPTETDSDETAETSETPEAVVVSKPTIPPRVITKNGADLCTGEFLTNADMQGNTPVQGHYATWKNNPKVRARITKYWDEFAKSCTSTDSYLAQLDKFGVVWRKYYTHCRLPKALKVTTLNQLFIRFERRSGNPLAPDLVSRIVQNNKFLHLTDKYHANA
jgi:hypothetical protein